MVDYTTWIKEIFDSVTSINVIVDEAKMVQVSLSSMWISSAYNGVSSFVFGVISFVGTLIFVRPH